MPTVCIVTNELYPLSPGGIGRLMYNFAVANAGSATPVELHFLMPHGLADKAAALEQAFNGLAGLHYCPRSLAALGALGAAIDETGGGDSAASHMIESLRYYAGVLEAQRRLGAGRRFDVVEFPDFGGWGAAAIMAKRAGVAFADTALTVRLHSTFGVILDAEPAYHQPSDWIAAIHELERLALRDADRIIAHLPSIADLNRRRYGFDDAWRARVEVELPPIVLAEAEQQALAAKAAAEPAAPRDFLFSARLQLFKRPDTFIKAAVRFLDTDAAGEHRFLVASYGWDAHYVDWLRRLVPARWQRRILFLDKVAPAARAALLANSIVVIPSDYESLCLLAYEARMLGARVILNRECVAFGQEPALWREDHDCLFFDGDFASLATVMRRALGWEPAPMRPLDIHGPYWERPVRLPAAPPRGAATLGHLVYGFHTPDALAQCLQTLKNALGTLDGVHALAPRETFQGCGMTEQAWASFGVTLHFTSWFDPTPTEVAVALRAMACDLVAFVPAGVAIEPMLWRWGHLALTAHPEAACFTSHAVDVRDPGKRRALLNYGDGPTLALIASRVAHRASIFRRRALVDLGLRETADDRWFDDLCARLALSGAPVLVAPAALALLDGPPVSRLNSAFFFGSVRDEVARAAGLPWRSSALITLKDTVRELSREEAAQRAFTQRASVQKDLSGRHNAFQCGGVRLKAQNGNAASTYREVEIVAHDLAMGRFQLEWLGFKLARFQGVPQIEFREQQNAGKLFADSWPPPTKDQWGSYALLTGNPDDVAGEFFGGLTARESAILAALLTALPGLVDSLLLDHAAKDDWKDAAVALQACAQRLGDVAAAGA